MDNENNAIIGSIIHCKRPFKLQCYDKGFVIYRKQKILAIGDVSVLEQTKENLGITESKDTILTDSQLLIPGLIDTHIHAPQYPNAGLGYDKPLLEWLDTYTYPIEKMYKDQELCKTVFNAVVRKTLDHGTTTACYFASLYEDSSMVLVDSAIQNGQRALIGKINMIRLAPDDYLETPEESISNTNKFIEEVRAKDNELILPVITPRFALSVDMDLMKTLGDIAKNNDLHIQSHISENTSEIDEVHDLYNMGYAECYDTANLLTRKTIMAHGVFLTDDEHKLLAKRGTSVAHCPYSNVCLKSGNCDVRKLLNAGITVGLGTDVAGGPTPSIIEVMRSALTTSMNISFQKRDNGEEYAPLNYMDVFYLATLGGAQALSLDSKIGNFAVGKDFDALIIDMNIKNGATDVFFEYTPLELLQKFVYTGDDRNVSQVYVAGKLVKS